MVRELHHPRRVGWLRRLHRRSMVDHPERLGRIGTSMVILIWLPGKTQGPEKVLLPNGSIISVNVDGHEPQPRSTNVKVTQRHAQQQGVPRSPTYPITPATTRLPLPLLISPPRCLLLPTQYQPPSSTDDRHQHGAYVVQPEHAAPHPGVTSHTSPRWPSWRPANHSGRPCNAPPHQQP